MSSESVKKVSHEDIQLVQNLIERCLQLYMNQKEVVDTLLTQAKIEPGFTELVWQKLEEENREFFKAYHIRLVLKNQIIAFNQLLEKQVELMRKVCPSGVASVPLPNGSTSATVHQAPPGPVTEHASSSSGPEKMLSNGDPTTAFINGGSMGQQGIQVGNDASVHTGTMDIPTNILSTQNLSMRMLNGMNGTTVRPEFTYPDNSEFAFCTNGGFLGAHKSIEDAPGASFSGSDLAGTPLNEPLLDADTSSFGFQISQIPRNFSFSDLTDDFAQCSDILENYGRSPFIAAGANNFSDSPGRECNGENRRLNTISEGISYEDLGSD